jgi:hypothetical protein
MQLVGCCSLVVAFRALGAVGWVAYVVDWFGWVGWVVKICASVKTGATSGQAVAVLVARNLVTLNPVSEMVAVLIARRQFEFAGRNLIG